MKTKGVYFSAGVAAILWFLMFSPWVDTGIGFWPSMGMSSVILTFLAFTFSGKELLDDLKGFTLTQFMLGAVIAVVLWGVFWLGDVISSWMFDFARPQVDSIYSMKDGFSKTAIGIQLFILTGPAEEIFWRGFVQKKIAPGNPNKAFALTLFLYCFIHIWSLNFMLLGAAAVAGLAWGLLYRIRPQWLPALVISHALWDAAVFVVFPI